MGTGIRAMRKSPSRVQVMLAGRRVRYRGAILYGSFPVRTFRARRPFRPHSFGSAAFLFILSAGICRMERKRIGIIGCGTIGRLLGVHIRDHMQQLYELAAVASRTREHAEKLGRELNVPACTVDEIMAECDLVVETASASAMPGIVRTALAAHREIVCLSVGGFVLDEALLEDVMAADTPVHVPSGAVAGLDGIRALREMGLESLSLTTIKRPESLGLSNISELPSVPEGVREPVSKEARILFEGTASEAIRRFPANVNVAVALALAGPGPEKTRMRLIADPEAAGTSHHIVARAGRCALDITASPSALPENPRSSALAMYSVPALLRQLAEPVRFAG